MDSGHSRCRQHTARKTEAQVVVVLVFCCCVACSLAPDLTRIVFVDYVQDFEEKY